MASAKAYAPAAIAVSEYASFANRSASALSDSAADTKTAQAFLISAGIACPALPPNLILAADALLGTAAEPSA